MAIVTVRNLKEQTKRALQHRAVRRGVSMEQEIREILDDAASVDHPAPSRPETGESLYKAIRRLVEPYGGFDIEIPPRNPPREPPKFE